MRRRSSLNTLSSLLLYLFFFVLIWGFMINFYYEKAAWQEGLSPRSEDVSHGKWGSMETRGGRPSMEGRSSSTRSSPRSIGGISPSKSSHALKMAISSGAGWRRSAWCLGRTQQAPEGSRESWRIALRWTGKEGLRAGPCLPTSGDLSPPAARGWKGKSLSMSGRQAPERRWRRSTKHGGHGSAS